MLPLRKLILTSTFQADTCNLKSSSILAAQMVFSCRNRYIRRFHNIMEHQCPWCSTLIKTSPVKHSGFSRCFANPFFASTGRSTLQDQKEPPNRCGKGCHVGFWFIATYQDIFCKTKCVLLFQNCPKTSFMELTCFDFNLLNFCFPYLYIYIIW